MATPPRPRGQQQGAAPRSAGQVPNRLLVFDRFEKMNTKVMRHNLLEQEASWMENLQPIAANDLKIVPGPQLPSLATLSSSTIFRLYFANVDPHDYIVAFTVGGGGYTIDCESGKVVNFAPEGTFSRPDMTVWASQRILIIDDKAGYSTWDGTAFVSSANGALSPNIVITAGGTGYATPPTVTISGGSGSGATATAQIAGGSVVGVTLTNGGSGYLPTDTLTVDFTPAPGDGGSGATATINVMPQMFGTTLDVAFGRVWTGNGRILSFTGTGGFDDIDPANAAGSTTITDYDLVHSITAIRNRNNLLFIFGDQSIRILGSISVQFSVTLFTPVTLASDIGTTFLMTIVSYNRLLFFANKHGVYGIFGSTVQKVSDDLDGIFIRTDFSLEPSAALNDLNNIHCYLLLLRYNDPVLGSRSIICVFQQSQSATWFVTSQGDYLKAIVWAPKQTTVLIETFGTSGTDITWLLQDQNAIMPIKLETSLSVASEALLAKVAIRAGIAAYSRDVQTQFFSLDTENRKIAYGLETRAGQFHFPYTSVDGYGKFLGVTVVFHGNNYNLNAIAIEFQDADLWGILPETTS